MESCNGAEREVTNVMDKLAKFISKDGDDIAQLVKTVQAARDEIASGEA